MAREIRAYLVDILDACNRLGTFTEGRTLQDYLGDAMCRSAVERQFEIIGEAVRVATRHAPELQERITDCAAIIAFRNQLRHGYSAVDHRTVWGILQSRVPTLKSAVEALLAELQ
jgi:uncharacterized protein with HEPN domain